MCVHFVYWLVDGGMKVVHCTISSSKKTKNTTMNDGTSTKVRMVVFLCQTELCNRANNMKKQKKKITILKWTAYSFLAKLNRHKDFDIKEKNSKFKLTHTHTQTSKWIMHAIYRLYPFFFFLFFTLWFSGIHSVFCCIHHQPVPHTSHNQTIWERHTHTMRKSSSL